MPRNGYPKELEAFVREKYKSHTARQLAPLVKEAFGIDMTAKKVYAYVKNHGIHYGQAGKRRPGRKITTPEIDAFILGHYKGTGHRTMADLVNAEFGTAYTAAQMKRYYYRNKLDSGLAGRFKPGHPSPNKGKTWDEFMSREGQEASRRTQFKKGHIPHNGGTPVGTIRLRRATEGKPGSHAYYYQKVAEPNAWRAKHVIEWEEHHGKAPERSMVTFADGDTLNWHIGNLVLTTRAQQAVKNRWGIHGHDKESAETANAIADLKTAISKAKKRNKRRKGER